MEEAGARLGVGRKAFARRVAWCWGVEPVLPAVRGGLRCVEVDGTYLPYGWCLLVAVGGDGAPVAWQWCGRENEAAYRELFRKVGRPGMLVCDGGRGCLAATAGLWLDVPVQRCLVHVPRDTRVDLTNRPRSEAGRGCSGWCAGSSG